MDDQPTASLPPRTTDEQDRVTHGQRRINLIWEMTQAFVAISVTGSTLYVSSRLAVAGGADMAAFLLLSNAFFLVIGFYFGRTNHQRVGGVGSGVGGGGDGFPRDGR
jgi:hypothetical protein